MRSSWIACGLLLVGIAVSGFLGCTRAKDEDLSKPVVLGNMVEPFQPPSLEELQAAHTWEDQPVLDGMQIMRDYQAEQGPPEAPVEEALALENDSEEANRMIRDAVGRLAPEDGAGVDYDATFVRHTTFDIKSTISVMRSSVTEFEYHRLTSITLIDWDHDLRPFGNGDAVESWQVSEDRMVDLFVLRDDLTWSDGTPFTAHDVEFTFNTIMTEEIPIPAVRQGTDLIRYVKAYDDRTVAIFHKEALPIRTESMQIYILPKHVFEDSIPKDPSLARSAHHRKIEDNPISAGPYILTKRIRGDEFVLTRRDSYYMHEGKQVRDKPYFREIRVKIIDDPNPALLALKAGEVQEMMLSAEQWANQTGGDDYYRRNTKATAPEWVEFHIVWNTKAPYFTDKRVRQAMSYAFDYDEMIDKIFYGLYDQCRGPFHPNAWWFPEDAPEKYVQNLEKAKQLLDDAGWKDSDGDGIRDNEFGGRTLPFKFTLLTATTPNSQKVATLMKESLDKIGVQCLVKPTEQTVLQQTMQDHKFDASVGGWGSGSDPFYSANIYKTGEGRNYGEYSSPRVDELYEAGRMELDREKRKQIYGEIHHLLWEDQPYTWLFNRNSFYGFNKDLRGYNFSPTGPFDFAPGLRSFYVHEAQP
jgi:peptide/nickel transport system substrate-binding protein